MKILIFNWRDIKNPKSGGAEILTHEIAKQWLKFGHEVIVFASEFENSKKEELVDGVRIIRRGHPDARFLFSSVHFQAFLYYKRNFENNIDRVLDEVHGLPFFTPWYVKEKKVALICEVAGELWVEMFGNFFGSIGRLVEKFYLSSIYKKTPILTISNSTKDELLDEGVFRENITVLPMGLSIPDNLKKFNKEKNPTLIFVGRLSKSKGIEDAIKALAKISKVLPNAKLWVVGRGEKDYLSSLKELAKKLKVDNISWYGYLNEEKKFELLAKSHILLAPSLKEGWGLTVPEAAFVGTPSIVYNSPGLRDVLKNNHFKIIVKSNDAGSLAQEALNILKDEDFYKKFNLENLDKKEYSWENTAQVAMELIK